MQPLSIFSTQSTSQSPLQKSEVHEHQSYEHILSITVLIIAIPHLDNSLIHIHTYFLAENRTVLLLGVGGNLRCQRVILDTSPVGTLVLRTTDYIL